ncbi:protein FAM219B isoform X5 [Myotis myotis]|uniref:protein FAM219B isoform X5 n=1 Tax=Myotis myotis TaxID=51298 RepID=UPI00174B517A|nr:protein FAM219B isoform X5 [Myotis myotis]
MATEERSGARPAGPASGRSGCGVPRRGEQTPAAVEKRGPYRMTRAPSIQAKLQKPRDLAKAALRRKGVLGAARRPDSSGKRSVKFNKGYTALSQSPDENLVSLNSDSDLVPAGAIEGTICTLTANSGLESYVMGSWNPDTPPGIPLQSR